MVDGHGAFEKEQDFGRGGIGCLSGVVDGHWAIGREQDSGLEGHDV